MPKKENEKLIPNLRFKGFTDDWIQQLFADLLDKEEGIRRGPFGSALKKDYFVSDSNYVVYEQRNAIDDHYQTRYNIPKEKFDELHRFVLQPDDFIMSGAGTIGRISRVPKEVKQGVFNQALIRMKLNYEVADPDFFIQWMRSDNLQRKLTQANPASAMANLVPMSELKEWKVIVPKKEEQVKLGIFISKIENIITLEQEILACYELIRENILSKVFPLGESLIPELRFKSFKGNWVQIPLSEISDKVNNKNTDKKYTITLTNSATQGIMSQSEYFDKQISNPKNIDNYYVVNNDDFVYNPRISLSAPYGPLNRNTLGFTGIMSPLYYVFKPRNINLDYLEYYFKSTNWHKFMYQNGDTGARSDRFSISNKLFETMPIKVPVQIEQDKIGRMLKQLDDIIILEQHKVEKLNKIKKTLLNKLFV